MKNVGVGCALTAQPVAHLAIVASKLATYTLRAAFVCLFTPDVVVPVVAPWCDSRNDKSGHYQTAAPGTVQRQSAGLKWPGRDFAYLLDCVA
jgi:hypothetical protein